MAAPNSIAAPPVVRVSRGHSLPGAPGDSYRRGTPVGHSRGRAGGRASRLALRRCGSIRTQRALAARVDSDPRALAVRVDSDPRALAPSVGLLARVGGAARTARPPPGEL